KQQYVKLAIVRRDATFAMCGKSAAVVLSGNDLVAGEQPEAASLVRERNWVWLATVVALALGVGLIWAQYHGTSSYFDRTNGYLTGLWAAAVAMAIPMMGGALRAWGGPSRITAAEWGFGFASLVTIFTMVFAGTAWKPRLGDIAAALEAKDPERARTLMDAVK